MCSSDLDAYAALARRAIAAVDLTLDLSTTRLVVEVPATEADLDRALGARPGTYAGIAAVTAPVDGATTATAPVHVFVNPGQFDRLRPQGAQVVMTHETTHAATHAVTSRAPLWLVEGFADWVALQAVPLPVSTTARELIAQVRRDGPPRTLPTRAEFGVQSETLDATYEASWQACRLLSERFGDTALRRLYDLTSAGTPFGPTLRRLTGLTLADFTAAWRTRLAGLVP